MTAVLQSDIPEEAIAPQPGPQTQFLQSTADIVVYGGAAGGGKTFGLLMDPLRYVGNPDFGAVLFRRTYPEITGQDGIWEESVQLYDHLGTTLNESDLKHTFASGATIRFAHLQHEKTKFKYKGSQIAYIGFDELSSFTRGQFFYMLSRNRSMSGVKPQVRAGTNPPDDGADHWLTKLLWWWIDTDEDSARYGLPIEGRAGTMRYFARDPDDALVWGGSKDEVIDRAPHLKKAAEVSEQLRPEDLVKSLTFIPAQVYDNELLLERNPEYLANLMSLESGDQERLLSGNWLKKVADGDVFDKNDFDIIHRRDVPAGLDWTRHWDLAGTAPSEATPNPDWTVGLLLAEKDGIVYWRDAVMMREDPGRRDEKIRNVARRDGRAVKHYIEQEPGQSGKTQIQNIARNLLQGYAVEGHRPSGAKHIRWQAPASAAQRGDIKVVQGSWNERALNHLDDVSASDGSKKDVADALAQFWDTRLASQSGGETVQSSYIG